MIRKLRQWLNSSFNTIEAHNPLEGDGHNHLANENPLSHNLLEKSVKDTDLEFLFHQLLEGIAKGWQENRIEQFFEKAKPKITIEVWLNWLQRYRHKLISSSHSHNQIASKMIILGQRTASLPFVRSIGDLAYAIGNELLSRENNNSLVESLRSQTTDISSDINPDSSNNNPDQEPQEVPNPSSLGDFLHLLENNPSFAEDTARKLGLDTADPGIIMEKIVQKTRLNSPTPVTESFSPDKVNQLFNLGLEKASQGDLEGAIADWDQALAIDQNFTQAWHNRGSALAYLKHFEEAVKSFDRAIALDVNYHQSWNDRGNALYSLQRWREAIISWDRTLGIQPDNYQAWYHRGLALEKLNLFPDAIASFQKCLSIENNYKPAENALKRVFQLIN
ncbi:tetratricopeptide repeat protein [Geminocystis sp. GBBB08]|uniref:tetratricopeptide repeat protein n=1 Tax=Geminocystis sp. GBBB08 TaxID=2604140 RepID=UPI0027E2A8F4|nr:tetratricopeptide repeat protein [Geminocystis sp. GBBB08]MBL1208682.1 tetratricopeptide repeat protein [Geminocystis sp. GBBB08]